MNTDSPDLKAAMLDRIRADATRKVWTPSDFVDLASRDAVDKALQRLTKAETLRRIDRGLYDQPGFNKLTQKPHPPDPRSVIDAVGRRDQTRMLVDGMTAANDLGLTDAVPAKIVVHTDARRRAIKLGNVTITFRPTAASKLFWAGRPAMRVVQALHWLRDLLVREGESDHIKRKLARLFEDPTAGPLKADLTAGLSALPTWMRVFLKPLIEADADAASIGRRPIDDDTDHASVDPHRHGQSDGDDDHHDDDQRHADTAPSKPKPLSASAIAAKLGATFEVVAQQLFDALLLPPVPPTTAAMHVERPLNPLQASAATHRGEAYLLEAGPGTGKTQTLITRVEGLLEEGVDPRRILLLTFSNKAAGEMAERIARKRPGAATAMWIGTFHAFGLDIIRRFHAELGLPKDPRMMDRTEAVELLEEEFPRLRLIHYRNLYDPTQIIADILAAVSRAKDEVVDAETYATLAGAMLAKAEDAEAREAAERASEVARVYAAYEQLKRNALCVDFGDLVALPVQLLEKDAAICAALQAQYDHVLVDEYQDVNRSSVRLLNAMRPDGRNLWMVGDAKQSIYRFRGASSFNVTRFGKEDFPGGKRGRLKRNYRSVPEIVASFSGFAITMRAGDAESGLDPDREGRGQKPELRTVQRAEQQQVALADAIEELRREGYAYREQAVLCTGNEKLSTIGHDLERLGVPVLFLGSLFERAEVKDLLALLSVLVDRRAMGLVRIACWPEFTSSFADVATIFEHLRAGEHTPGSWLQQIDTIPGVSDAGRQALSRLAVALNGSDHTAPPWTTLASLLLDRTRIAARLGTSADLADRTRGIAIWQFLNFVRVQPAGRGLPITRLLDRVRRLVRLGDDRDLRQLPAAAQHLDAVRLMTIHGAKGLEFGGVHIPGLNSDTIPRTPPAPPCPAPDGMIAGAEGSALEAFRAGQAEEQECLFYVGQSRARDRLILYAPTEKSNGHNRPLSPFLDRLGTTLTRRSVVPARALPVAAEARGVELVIDGRMRFGAPQLALYESCPRRFFYTHILQVGGRRTATAFMHLHEAVRSVVETVIASDVPMTDRDLEDHTNAALAGEGLDDHGYSAEFRDLALTMLRFFLSNRAGAVVEPAVALSLTFGGEEITVRPDEVLVRPDGVRAVRRIRTGHLRSAESKDVGAAALILAVKQAFPGAVAELVHLSDGEVHPLSLSDRELKGRKDKLAKFLGDIRAGRFPAEISSRTCPNCPAFFICGLTPDGPLQKKFA